MNANSHDTTLTAPQKKSSHIGRLILAAVLTVLLFLKSLHLYDMIHVGKFGIPLAAITVGIVCFIYTIVVIFSPKAGSITLISVYCVLSLIMSVDLVYYNYMGKLPSAELIKMAWQLGGVGGTIKELTGIKQLLPILDLPLWLILPIAYKFFGERIPKKACSHRLHVLSSAATVLLCVLLVCGMTLFGPFKLRYIPNELLNYHARDIASVLFPGSVGKVNSSEYLNGDNSNSPFYGVAKDRNVFIIQVEALQDFVIGEDYKGEVLTPVLNSLIEKDSFYFNNYYYQIGAGNTSDAEFAVNNSLYPSEDGASYEKYTTNKFYGLPSILKDNGYSKATVFHAYREDFWSRNKAYPYQGFDDFISIEDMEFHPNEGCVFAINDKEANTDRRLFEDVLETVVTYEEPFYAFTITLSSHHPFAVAPADRYVDSDNPKPNLFNLYIQSAAYVDRVIGEFMDELKKVGLYDNSVFVIYSDHYAIAQTDEKLTPLIEEMTGEPYDIFERFKVPLIIHIPGLGTARTIDTVGAHVDVLPTLLPLLGIQNNKSVMFGHNLLDPAYEGIVYELAHVKAGSFITKDVFYTHSEGGINTVVYGKNGEILPNDEKYLETVEEAIKAIEDCHALLDSDSVVVSD